MSDFTLANKQYREMAELVRAIGVEIKRRNSIGINMYTGYIEQAALALDEISGGEIGNFTSECGPRERKAKAMAKIKRPVKGTYLTAGKSSTTTYEVRPHPFSPEHLLLVVNFRGRVYAQVSAYDPEGFNMNGENVKPTTSTVQYAWRHGRYEFLPYDESTGRFIAGIGVR